MPTVARAIPLLPAVFSPHSESLLCANGDAIMSDMPTPSVMRDAEFKQLKQVTLRNDEEIEQVNALLADGWRVLSIGQRSDATVYVLGRVEERQRTRAGFLPAS